MRGAWRGPRPRGGRPPKVRAGPALAGPTHPGGRSLCTFSPHGPRKPTPSPRVRGGPESRGNASLTPHCQGLTRSVASPGLSGQLRVRPGARHTVGAKEESASRALGRPGTRPGLPETTQSRNGAHVPLLQARPSASRPRPRASCRRCAQGTRRPCAHPPEVTSEPGLDQASGTPCCAASAPHL